MLYCMKSNNVHETTLTEPFLYYITQIEFFLKIPSMQLNYVELVFVIKKLKNVTMISAE